MDGATPEHEAVVPRVVVAVEWIEVRPRFVLYSSFDDAIIGSLNSKYARTTTTTYSIWGKTSLEYLPMIFFSTYRRNS